MHYVDPAKLRKGNYVRTEYADPEAGKFIPEGWYEIKEVITPAKISGMAPLVPLAGVSVVLQVGGVMHTVPYEWLEDIRGDAGAQPEEQNPGIYNIQPDKLWPNLDIRYGHDGGKKKK